MEPIFELYGGDLTDPYSLWVGFYEFGREAGQPFPFYQILSRDPEPMTGAFPEYVWSTCLRYLGLSAEDLAERGRFSPAIYRERFLAQDASYEDYQNRPTNDEWNGVAPGQLIAAILYYLHMDYGDTLLERFFAIATERQAHEDAPSDGHQAACNFWQIAVAAATPDTKKEIGALLKEQWRFPADCTEYDDSCPGSTMSSCAPEHGAGVHYRTCTDGVWSGWGSCRVRSCDDGHLSVDDACQETARPVGLER